jgi:D-3-phosphoglycerate dehydrogenase
LIKVSGRFGDKPVLMAGTHMEHKGPVLVEVNGYEIELPITRYVLLVRNDDRPGVIGRVGTYLGMESVNIANMVVGRAPSGEAAMMGINLDDPLSDEQVAAVRALDGIEDARFIELTVP